MHNPESIPENETHKLLWDFEIQTDHLISARRPELIIVNKKKKKMKTFRFVNFAVPADHRVELKKAKRKMRNLDFAGELKKIMGHESDGDTNYNWCNRYSHRRIDTGTGGLGNKRTSGNHPNSSIFEINYNSKSPGDLRRLAVTQTPVENHQLTLERKLSK